MFVFVITSGIIIQLGLDYKPLNYYGRKKMDGFFVLNRYCPNSTGTKP